MFLRLLLPTPAQRSSDGNARRECQYYNSQGGSARRPRDQHVGAAHLAEAESQGKSCGV